MKKKKKNGCDRLRPWIIEASPVPVETPYILTFLSRGRGGGDGWGHGGGGGGPGGGGGGGGEWRVEGMEVDGLEVEVEVEG